MDEDFNISSQEYYHEIIIFIAVASLLVLFKILACFHSLGLTQRHKEISRRTDPISRAQFYNLQTLALRQEESRKEYIPLEVSRSVQESFRNSSTQTEPREPNPILFPVFPKQESCLPNPESSGPSELTQLQRSHIVEVHFLSAN